MSAHETSGDPPTDWLTPALYRRLHDLVDQASLRPVGEREAWLASACSDDRRLLGEARALLDARQALDGPAPADAPRPPTRIGPYLIERELGQGGMGTVYLARRADDSYDKRVAIKLIRPDVDREDVLARFTLERRILASLDHPNIARLIDGGAMEDGRPYLAMDYVDGVPITTYADRARLSVGERLTLFRTVCAAVDHAHQNLVVHRDIKPTNILVTADGTPKLLDFGIAKVLTRGGRSANNLTAPLVNPGTPRYASPEQEAGEPVNTATDVYALGVVLFEILTAQMPRRAASGSAPDSAKPSLVVLQPPSEQNPRTARTIAAARGVTPEKLARRLRGDLDAIVQMALAQNVHERYRSVAELSEDLQRHLDRAPVLARPSTIVYRASRFGARHRGALVGAALVLLTLTAGIVATSYQWRRAEAERMRAERRFDSVRSLASSVLEAAEASSSRGESVTQELVTSSLRYLGQLERDTGGEPGFLREIAAGYRRVGDLQRGTADTPGRDTGAALASYRQAQRLAAQSVVTRPEDASAKRELAESFERVGTLLAETGDRQEGRESLRQSLALYEELVAADQASLRAQRDLMFAHLRYADAVGTDDRSAARSSFEEARRIAAELNTRDPEDAETRRDLQMASARLRSWETGGNSEASREEERRYFAAVKDSSDPARITYFLERFPDSEYAAALRLRLAALEAGTSPPRSARSGSRAASSSAPVVVAASSSGSPSVEADATPSLALGITWKAVPAGRFQMGCDLRPDRQCNPEERPRHWVTISRAFEMMATPVTLGHYRAYGEATGQPVPDQPVWNADEKRPVVNSTWDQAQRFCAASGARLPTEAEWEWAALGGRDGSVYPWGDTYSRTMANAGFPGRDGWDYTSPAGTFPPNGYGLYDMAGNVWEWVSDWYEPRYYEQSPDVDPQGPPGGISRVLRGGSYNRPPTFLRVTQRGIDSLDRRREATGFRCVR